MYRPGAKVGVICNDHNRPDREATKTLLGEILGVEDYGTHRTYTVRVEFHNGWLITQTNDESLLFPTFH
jgi:hypothetical protein